MASSKYSKGTALTLIRNADAVVTNPDDGLSYFVKPLELDELFSDFIHYIRDQELLNRSPAGNVKYSQGREWDGNIVFTLNSYIANPTVERKR